MHAERRVNELAGEVHELRERLKLPDATGT
jgi:hypothetical protein